VKRSRLFQSDSVHGADVQRHLVAAGLDVRAARQPRLQGEDALRDKSRDLSR
jgi:hypothetical protein